MSIAAISRFDERLREDAAAREAEHSRLMQEYASLLLDDADKHAEAIAELMFSLDLPPERVEADVRAIREARRLQGLAANANQASEDYTAEINRVAGVEYVAAQRARLDLGSKIYAANHADACKRAAGELAELAAERPYLFTRDDGIVRLHGDDVHQQGDEAADAHKLQTLQSKLARVDRELQSAVRRLEKDIAGDEQCKVSAWRRYLVTEKRRLERAIEQLDDAPADATDGDADEE